MTVPIFDKADALERMMDDEELLLEIIELYNDDTADLIQQLVLAAETSDQRLLHRAAHTVKGSSANIGAMRIMSVATLMEKECVEGNLQRAALYIPELTSELEVFKEEAAKAF